MQARHRPVLSREDAVECLGLQPARAISFGWSTYYPYASDSESLIAPKGENDKEYEEFHNGRRRRVLFCGGNTTGEGSKGCLWCWEGLYADGDEAFSLVKRMEGHTKIIYALHWQKLEQLQEGCEQQEKGRVLSCSFDGTLRVWDGDSLNCIAVFDDRNLSHGFGIYAIATPPPDKSSPLPSNTIFCGCEANVVGCLDVSTQQTQHIFSPAHSNGVRCLTLVGDKLYSGSWDCTIRCWDAKSYSLIGQMSGHKKQVWCLLAVKHPSLPPSGFLFSGSEDGTIGVWQISTNQQKRALYQHEGQAVWSLAFCGDGNRGLLLSGGTPIQQGASYNRENSTGCLVCVWDITTLGCVAILNPGIQGGTITSIQAYWTGFRVKSLKYLAAKVVLEENKQSVDWEARVDEDCKEYVRGLSHCIESVDVIAYSSSLEAILRWHLSFPRKQKK